MKNLLVALVFLGFVQSTLTAGSFTAPARLTLPFINGNIFGVDNRQAITSNDYPWRTIGFMEGVRCTGTMISKNLVLTAAHCVIDSATKKLSTNLGNFYPNYIDGNSTHKSWINHVWWGTDSPDTYRESDWAILLLAENIGTNVGWMGIKGNGDDYTSVNVAGYSGDFLEAKTAGVHIGCNVKSPVSDPYMTHDCDTTRGSSGGPMFITESGNNAFIVGLNVAERRENGEVSLKVSSYSDKYANLAVRVGRFLPKVRELIQTYDSRP